MGPFTRLVSHLVSINEVHGNWESDHHQKSGLTHKDLIQESFWVITKNVNASQ